MAHDVVSDLVAGYGEGVADLVARYGTERALVRRRRRDGTMVLVGEFPPWRPFYPDALFDPDIASVERVDGDEIVVGLANARGVYRVVSRGPAGVAAELVSVDYPDADT